MQVQQRWLKKLLFAGLTWSNLFLPAPPPITSSGMARPLVCRPTQGGVSAKESEEQRRKKTETDRHWGHWGPTGNGAPPALTYGLQHPACCWPAPQALAVMLSHSCAPLRPGKSAGLRRRLQRSGWLAVFGRSGPGLAVCRCGVDGGSCQGRPLGVPPIKEELPEITSNNKAAGGDRTGRPSLAWDREDTTAAPGPAVP